MIETGESTDPEYYTTPESVEGVSTVALKQAYDTARHVYYTCGGHWRAYRMEKAMEVLSAELAARGIIPEFLAGDVTWEESQ